MEKLITDIEQKIIEQEDLKIPFRKNFKIMETGKSTDHLISLLTRVNWNQTEQDLKLLAELSKSGNYIAGLEEEDKFYVLGSALITEPSGVNSWIGMVLVNPLARQQGIAFELMIKCLSDIRKRSKAPVIGLDATPEGKILYDKLGFKTSMKINRCLLETDNIPRSNTMNFTQQVEFNKEIANYLRTRNLERLFSLYERLFALSEGSNFVYRKNGNVQGLVMNRKGRRYPFIGPLLADSYDVAQELINLSQNYWKKRDQKEVLMDMPSVHMMKVKRMNGIENSENSLQVIRPFDRMYHLIDDKNRAEVAEYINSKKDGIKEREILISEMLNKSKECHDKTRYYQLWEKEKLLPYLYGTGGPEFS